jgi:cytochrome oxidase Cu insertion factor (SCO1/SenC/PrrC family)
MKIKTLVSICLLLCAGAAVAGGHDKEDRQGGAAPPQAPTQSRHDQAARAYFTDLTLLTQASQPVRFYTDVLKDKVVLVNFIYTSCESACPMLTTKLNLVRQALGDLFGQDVFFISLSVDPEQDNPAMLREFARERDADYPGWTFLTGEKAHVDRIVTKFGQYTESVEDHSMLLIAGNVKTRHWAKIPPNDPVDAIVARLRQLVAEG